MWKSVCSCRLCCDKTKLFIITVTIVIIVMIGIITELTTTTTTTNEIITKQLEHKQTLAVSMLLRASSGSGKQSWCLRLHGDNTLCCAISYS